MIDCWQWRLRAQCALEYWKKNRKFSLCDEQPKVSLRFLENNIVKIASFTADLIWNQESSKKEPKYHYHLMWTGPPIMIRLLSKMMENAVSKEEQKSATPNNHLRYSTFIWTKPNRYIFFLYIFRFTIQNLIKSSIIINLDPSNYYGR